MGVLSDIEEYRRDADEFLTVHERLEYLHHAGHAADLPVAPLFERFEHLFADEVARELVGALDGARPGGGAASVRALAGFAVDGAMRRCAARESQEVARREAAATVPLDGDRVGYRAAAALIANEPDAARRATIHARCEEVVQEELTPVLAEGWSTRHALARALGAASYRDLYARVRGIDLDALAGQCRDLLSATDDLYVHALDAELRRTVGVTLEDARRSDLPRLRRAASLDARFPAARLLRSLADTLSGLGIDLARLPNIVVDAEPRATKDPRAFCSPVRVPDEVYLVIAPIGGVDDFLALFHEAGHALHFGGTGRGLPVEFRRMGDDSVTETYAFLLEHLVNEPLWLSRVMGLPESAEQRRLAAVQALFHYRRYAGKLLYELELHGSRDLAGMGDRYAEILTSATRVPHRQAAFLDDVDPGFYSACYLRAWALEVSLRGHLRDRFGSRWFETRRAGGLLRELWNEGQRMDADTVAGELGLPPLDLAVLVDEVGAVLG
ncbi:MAG: hypothetical protein AB1416_04590 [Actinomycetota bacterium]